MRPRFAARPAADKIRVAVFRVGRPMAIEMVDPGLFAAQKLVGGNCQWLTIEAFSSGGTLTLVCNEDGRLFRLPANKLVIFKLGGVYAEQIILGDFFVERIERGGTCASLQDVDLVQLPKLVGF